jgi:hypothetical protein
MAVPGGNIIHGMHINSTSVSETCVHSNGVSTSGPLITNSAKTQVTVPGSNVVHGVHNDSMPASKTWQVMPSQGASANKMSDVSHSKSLSRLIPLHSSNNARISMHSNSKDVKTGKVLQIDSARDASMGQTHAASHSNHGFPATRGVKNSQWGNQSPIHHHLKVRAWPGDWTIKEISDEHPVHTMMHLQVLSNSK